MMRIHKDFIGGNIVVKEQIGTTFVLENELRDTTENWFYWAFCVEGAEGQTLTFQMQYNRLGYFGPAISYDLVNWHWLDRVGDDEFTYEFRQDESKVYFAHSILYHPDRFLKFANERNIPVTQLCKGYRGSSVPCVQLGDGEINIILTARHHACESTGSYVLEGVLDELIQHPIPNTKILCVPFVDYEGVIRGDQGKCRAPYDHNRDYSTEVDSIYPECNAIKEYAERNGCHYGFDFHSPWHMRNENDNVFIVQNSFEKLDRLNRFGELLEDAISETSIKYFHKDDCPFGTGWNQDDTLFARYMIKRNENNIAVSFEIPYFGLPENKVDSDKLLEFGRCFVNALKAYMQEGN